MAAGRCTVFLDPRACRSTEAPTSHPTRAAGCRASGCEWKPSSTPSRASAGDRRRAARDARAARRDRSHRAGPRATRGRRPRRGAAGPAGHRRPRAGRLGRCSQFPPASALELLLATRSRDGGAAADAVVEATLDAMAAGGIHDQLGGGFARYSVDAQWLFPHFEKMLYDNALLARAYLHGWQALGHERWRRTCEATLDWMLREMRGPRAASTRPWTPTRRGEEGVFYVWTPSQIREVLGDDAGAVIDLYGVTEAGNFEGANILHLPGGATPAARRLSHGMVAASEFGRGPAGSARGPCQARLAGPRRQAAQPPGTPWRSPPWRTPAQFWGAPTTSRPRPACAEFVPRRAA